MPGLQKLLSFLNYVNISVLEFKLSKEEGKDQELIQLEFNAFYF